MIFISSSNTTYTADQNAQYVLSQGSIIDTTGVGILATGDYQSLSIAGRVHSAGDSAVVSKAYGANLTVTSSGAVSGLIGFSILGEHSQLESKGTVLGIGPGSIGILAENESSFLNVAGLVKAETAILSTLGNLSVGPDAQVIGTKVAIQSSGHWLQFINNEGLISAGSSSGTAILGDDSAQSIVNNPDGRIVGSVYLAGGDDHFSNTGGIVEGTVYGGKGDDEYSITDGSVHIVEKKGEGIDTLNVFTSWQLGANLENLGLYGSGDINGYGNELDNRLTGNDHNNMLSGELGNDVLFGGEGNDTLKGGGGADVFVFGNRVEPVSNHDVITDFKDGTDHINLSGFENLTDFSDLLANYTFQIGADLVIKNNFGDELTIRNFSKSLFDVSDVSFDKI